MTGSVAGSVLRAAITAVEIRLGRVVVRAATRTRQRHAIDHAVQASLRRRRKKSHSRSEPPRLAVRGVDARKLNRRGTLPERRTRTRQNGRRTKCHPERSEGSPSNASKSHERGSIRHVSREVLHCRERARAPTRTLHRCDQRHRPSHGRARKPSAWACRSIQRHDPRISRASPSELREFMNRHGNE